MLSNKELSHILQYPISRYSIEGDPRREYPTGGYPTGWYSTGSVPLEGVPLEGVPQEGVLEEGVLEPDSVDVEVMDHFDESGSRILIGARLYKTALIIQKRSGSF